MNGMTGMSQTVSLKVGEEYHLRRGKDHITYAGMPSEDVYSIVQRKANGYQGFAWNLYFPRNLQEITIDGVGIYVVSVTPRDIELRPA